MGNRWNGGVATIEEYPDEDVWGVVWKMATEDITSLDKYEKLFFQPAPVYSFIQILYIKCIIGSKISNLVKTLGFFSFGCLSELIHSDI